MEFKHLYSRKEGQRPENKAKNRYKNILPCMSIALCGYLAPTMHSRPHAGDPEGPGQRAGGRLHQRQLRRRVFRRKPRLLIIIA